MMHVSIIPQECVDKFNLKDKAYNGYIFAQVTKGVYEPPQAGLISHDTLVKHLEPYGYHPFKKKARTMDTRQSPN